jgi:Tol biopolymer transport system component/DNA-binding winged helix-turn-helix (wHTH) protein
VPSPVFEFGRFKLDIDGYELRRVGRKIKLQRVPMDLLILLVERKGMLVTREEIASRVWDGDGFVDTQSSINTAIRKIRQALDDDTEDPHFIETIVGKGYRFIGEVLLPLAPQGIPLAIEEAPAIKTQASIVPVQADTQIALAKPQRLRSVLAGVIGAFAICAIAVSLFARTSRRTEPLTILPFAAAPGARSWPAFSPDGSQVAFGWTGETGNCSHIYVKGVNSVPPVQLTNDKECDQGPSWSRDGQQIAFLRGESPGQFALYIISAKGGGARRISDTGPEGNFRPAWTPDGKALLVMNSALPDGPPSVVRVEVSSGEKRMITTAQPTSTGDWCPAYSPDGHMLAYLHNTGSRRLSLLYVVPVDSTGLPTESARIVETGSTGFSDFDWSADGRSLIATTGSGLVRVALPGGDVQSLPFLDGSQPTVAFRGDRMVYLQPLQNSFIFRAPGPGASGPVTRLISSTRQQLAAQYAPDDRRIAFVSDRSGSEEIWIADAEGRDARQITFFGGPPVGSPRWSPDGRWIAFDTSVAGHASIYVVSDKGGAPHRITATSASSVRPSWSHDGKWIYFGSNQGDQWQIWKTTPQGGTPIQVTRGGGREAFETSSGTVLYYTKTPPEVGIWRIRLNAKGDPEGEEERASKNGRQGHWAMGSQGFYYLDTSDRLMFQDFSGKKVIPIPTLGLPLSEGTANMIGSSPNDRWVLLSVVVHSEQQLNLVSNFR